MPSTPFIAQRFRNQHITGEPASCPGEIVRLLGAVQSQDYLGAKWSLGQRLQGATDRAIDEAFNSGAFLRTHVLRPTWHFVAAEDIRWMLALTAPHVHRLNAYQNRRAELDPPLFKRLHRLIVKALQGGNHLTRAELAAEFARSRIVADGVRLAYVMMHAELEGLVCSGALKGKQQTYALLDERVPPIGALSREESVSRLLRRFFIGHAPATLKQFAWWSGIGLTESRRALDGLRTEFAGETVDGVEWFGLSDIPKSRAVVARLIPEYDESLTGGRDLRLEDRPCSAPGQWVDDYFRPVIINWARVGTWRRTIGTTEASLELNLSAPLAGRELAAVNREAARYGQFLGVPLTVVS
ncbi:MAG: winged helix DNA-binding domain-containing protein [Gemmatimonadota bacterium]